MIKFKDLISEEAFNRPVDFPSVEASFSGRTLSLRFDSKDKLLYAGYSGKFSPWFSSLCALIINKNLAEILKISMKTWEEYYQDDQLFWDLKQEEDSFISEPLELLRVALDIFFIAP